MPYDSAATRSRLLDSAYGEFVERGLAGARVDRIASAAAANKQAIYLYFGSKDALFDAVLDSRLAILADLVPFTPTDLESYIGALFDQFNADPGLMRLTQWKALERDGASEAERDAHLAKAEELGNAYNVSPERGMDVMMLTLAMAQAWNSTAATIRNPGGADASARILRHRKAVIAAVSAAADALLHGE